MALIQQNIALPFSSGLDLKTDSYQVRPPKVLTLQNGVFTVGNSIHKRFGYDALSQAIAGTTNKIVSALGGANYLKELVLFDGISVYSYNQTGFDWVPKGAAVSLSLNVIPAVRNTTQQTSQDSAFHPIGYYCFVWEDSDGTSKYSIIDSTTQQTVVYEVSLPTNAVQPKVVALGQYFLISYIDSSTHHLRKITIPIVNPNAPTAPLDLSTTVSTTNSNYDSSIINGRAYFAWNNATGSVSVCFIDSFLVQSATLVITGHTATICIAIFGDNTGNFVWITAYDGTTIAYTVQNVTLGAVPTPLTWTILETLSNVRNVTGSVLNSTGQFYYEVSNTISYNTLVRVNTGTIIGIVGTPRVFLRSVGLWVKCFQYNGIVYLGVTYQSQLQPVYFIVNASGMVITKLAYQNAGGLTQKSLLPQINTIFNGRFEVAYLIKDLLEAQSGNIYTQTGINAAILDFTNNNVFNTVTLGNNLHISGGILSMYDSISVVEHGFFVFPETPTFTETTGGGIGWGTLTSQPSWQYAATYEWTDNQGNIHRSAPSIPLTVRLDNGNPLTFTANTTTGNSTLTAVSSVAGLFVGQVLTGTGIQAGTTITSIGTTTITISLPATATGTTVTISTIDTNSNSVTIDTLRITQKVAPRTPVSIVLYRTLANQDIFYRVSSITSPTYNNTAADTVTIVDNTPDAALVGNELLYTTGGVLENICAPATNLLTTYVNRVMLVSAEDPNSIWYSQQTVPGSPVSFNDSLIQFIDPRGGEITSIFTLDDKLVTFKENSLFYFSGQGPTPTGANNDFTDPFLVTTDCGCINQNSIVTMPFGLMFQSTKGIYLLDRGLNTAFIGAEVGPNYNSQMITASALVPNTNQVRFTLESGITLMYDYFYKQWGTFTNQFAVDAVVFQDLFTYFNPNGIVFQENLSSFTDNGEFIPLLVTTSWIQLAGLQGYQRCYKIYFLGTYKSPHKLQFSVAYDFNPGSTQVVQADATSLYSGGAIYGQGNVYGDNGIFGGPAPTEQWRLDLIQQKCQSVQITIQDVQTAPYGEGLSLSGLTFIAGVKKGLNKVGPSNIIS